MDALQSLAREHRLILRTLDAFEGYVGYVEAELAAERSDLRRFVGFFQDFADHHHHHKEEALLFPALLETGLDWSGPPLAQIRSEHDQEHYLLHSLEHAALQSEPWSEDDRRHFSSVARAFIAFQRCHVRFETIAVYPRAELLSELSRARLSEELKRFDEGVRLKNAELTDLAELLIRRYVLNERSPCEGTNRPDRNSPAPR